MTLTINQLLDAVFAAGDAAKAYAAHDAERETAIADAAKQVATLQASLVTLQAENAKLKAQIAAEESASQGPRTFGILASTTKTMAGLPVFVTLNVIPDTAYLHDIRWDFGDDTDGAEFVNLSGFNAAHIYNHPGTYQITVKVNGETAGIYIEVTAADVNFINRLEDARSNCRNVLMVQAIERTSTFWPKIHNATIEGMAGVGTKLVYVGKEGDACLINCPRECDNLVLVGLTFDSASGKGATYATAINRGKSRLSVVKCVAQRLANFVLADANRDGSQSSGLLVRGCKALSPDGLQGYFVWFGCNDVVILDNDVANSTRQHIVRGGYYSRVLISNNQFTNLDRRPADPQDYSKGCIVSQRGSHVWVEQNKSHLGGIGVGPLGGSDGVSDKAGRTTYAVVKNNTVDGGNCISVMHGAAHVRVQDNVIDRGAADLSGIEVDGFDATYQRTVEDLTVTGNRQIRAGGTAPAVWFKTPGQVGVNNNDNLIVTSADKAALAGKGAS